MQLRPHQIKAKEMARDSIKRGLKRPLIAAPTGFGKTVLAADMMEGCQKLNKRGWFFCDRINLVDQTIDKFRQFDIDFGVRQSDHDLHNPNAPIQIASIQTVAAMVNKHGGQLPEFDFGIVDECSNQYEIIKTIIDQYNNIPIIGLDATPYTKGLGKLYNNLIVPITHRELEDEGYLCPIRYFVGKHIDLTKIRSTDPNTYSKEDLEIATEESKKMLTGDIIKNWLEYGENSQTIAFSPSQDQSKYMVQKFNENGISTEHIDCYTSTKIRREMYEAHNNGEFKILSCSRLLGIGYDSPSTRVLIDAYPVKSVKTYIQRAGRIARFLEGKECAIYLDHAGNWDKFGDAQDIFPTCLDDGSKPLREIDLTNKKPKEKAKESECPKCYNPMIGMSCECGFSYQKPTTLQDDGTMLVDAGNKANRTTPPEEKLLFLAGLYRHAKEKGYKEGWATVNYKEKFGVFPERFKPMDIDFVPDSVKGWVKHKQIKNAMAAKKAVNNIKAMT